MKHKLLVAMVLLLLLISFLSACGPGQFLAPTLTPQPTATATPTIIPTTAASTIALNCDDWALINKGVYQAQNNTWGKGKLSGWSQCIGIETGADGALMGRWTWDWLNSGGNVKAYPEIVFGQKPGGPTTSPDLPKKINSIRVATISYDVTSTYTGSGNIAFDFWLTDTQNPSTWGVPPITHEIMIWIDSYGEMHPGGYWKERVSIDGSLYDVFVGEKYGDGWRYIAFNSTTSQLGVGTLNLASFLEYIQTKGLATGDEYLASIEFGNEVVSGAGETILNKYAVSVK